MVTSGGGQGDRVGRFAAKRKGYAILHEKSTDFATVRAFSQIIDFEHLDS
jgi:hypothetical protein